MSIIGASGQELEEPEDVRLAAMGSKTPAQRSQIRRSVGAIRISMPLLQVGLFGRDQCTIYRRGELLANTSSQLQNDSSIAIHESG